MSKKKGVGYEVFRIPENLLELFPKILTLNYEDCSLDYVINPYFHRSIIDGKVNKNVINMRYENLESDFSSEKGYKFIRTGKKDLIELMRYKMPDNFLNFFPECILFKNEEIKYYLDGNIYTGVDNKDIVMIRYMTLEHGLTEELKVL